MCSKRFVLVIFVFSFDFVAGVLMFIVCVCVCVACLGEQYRPRRLSPAKTVSSNWNQSSCSHLVCLLFFSYAYLSGMT